MENQCRGVTEYRNEIAVISVLGMNNINGVEQLECVFRNPIYPWRIFRDNDHSDRIKVMRYASTYVWSDIIERYLKNRNEEDTASSSVQ